MHVLALDTTTRDGSVALVNEHRVVEERRGDGARSHAERLPGELIALAEARGLSVGAIDVFAALYRVVDAPHFSPERLVEVEGAIVGDPGATLARWRHLREASVIFVGDGATLYADVIADHQAMRWEVLSKPPLLAGAIGRMAVARAQRGDTIDPAAVHPLYVRRPDVEVERERNTLEHNGHKGH